MDAHEAGIHRCGQAWIYSEQRVDKVTRGECAETKMGKAVAVGINEVIHWDNEGDFDRIVVKGDGERRKRADRNELSSAEVRNGGNLEGAGSGNHSGRQ